MHGDLASLDQRPWLLRLLAPVARRWWAVLGAGVIGLALASAYLHLATPVHVAELRVYPAMSSGGRPPSRLGGLAALAGLSAAGDPSPYRYYLDAIYSPEVAARLARDPALMQQVFRVEWDAAGQRWRQPSSLLGSIRTGLWRALGLPVTPWQAPDAARLQGWIKLAVTVRIGVKTPLSVLALEHPDPVFAKAFLERLALVTDDYLREKQAARTAGTIRYLSGQLAATGLIEKRQSIAGLLADQERQGMLAGSGARYAAETFGPAVASLEPVRPKSGLVLAAGMLVGLLLATVTVIVRDFRQARRR